jgi:hypothetical protein
MNKRVCMNTYMKPENKTTITVSKDTKQRLGECGTANETFEAIVVKLIACYHEYCREQPVWKN